MRDNHFAEDCGKSPLEMDECPNYYFGDFGMTCVPELCDKYTEVSE